MEDEPPSDISRLISTLEKAVKVLSEDDKRRLTALTASAAAAMPSSDAQAGSSSSEGTAGLFL